MKTVRSWMILMLAAFSAGSFAQAWMQPYEAGLKAAKSGNWQLAKDSFKQAIANRPDDYATATLLPGPPTEQRKWRNGSPYSPNFLSAYSGYRSALTITDTTEQGNQLRSSASEFETLLAKNQSSKETYFFLDVIYTRLGDTQKRLAASEKMAKLNGKLDWKVDTEVVAPEELAAINVNQTTPGNTVSNPIVTPGTTAPQPGVTVVTQPGMIPTLSNKFALVVGQGASKLNSEITYGASDAQAVRDALVSFAGYPQENVDLVTNATAAQIMASAKAIADRVPQDGVVFIYFTGAGVNLNGKDFLAGIDTESANDTASMVSKSDLYKMFMAKGARIFAFYQANRPTVNGFYFGSEQPLVGAIAQTQATLQDDSISTIIRNGKQVGIYTDAVVAALSDLRSNRIPIMEFGWQVFYKIRRGNTGSTGGASRQTPTLPQLINIAADARF